MKTRCKRSWKLSKMISFIIPWFSLNAKLFQTIRYRSKLFSKTIQFKKNWRGEYSMIPSKKESFQYTRYTRTRTLYLLPWSPKSLLKIWTPSFLWKADLFFFFLLQAPQARNQEAVLQKYPTGSAYSTNTEINFSECNERGLWEKHEAKFLPNSSHTVQMIFSQQRWR